jgi:hypothetical protein
MPQNTSLRKSEYDLDPLRTDESAADYQPYRHLAQIQYALNEILVWSWVEPLDVRDLVSRWTEMRADAEAGRNDMQYLAMLLRAAAARVYREAQPEAYAPRRKSRKKGGVE